jgi:hypothetical protein
MKIAMATAAVSVLAVAGVAYATQRRRARHSRLAFIRKLI